jgi:hypothetical protein
MLLRCGCAKPCVRTRSRLSLTAACRLFLVLLLFLCGVATRAGDLTQSVMLLYIAGSVPYRLGFDDPVVLWSGWFWLDLFIDLYFAADLFVNFRTAVIKVRA